MFDRSWSESCKTGPKNMNKKFFCEQLQDLLSIGGSGMIIYGRDTLYSFSGEFGSVYTRFWIDIPVSASLELTLSPVACGQ